MSTDYASAAVDEQSKTYRDIEFLVSPWERELPGGWACEWPEHCSQSVLDPAERYCAYHQKMANGWTWHSCGFQDHCSVRVVGSGGPCSTHGGSPGRVP